MHLCWGLAHRLMSLDGITSAVKSVAADNGQRRLSSAWLWTDFRQLHFGRSVTCKISVSFMNYIHYQINAITYGLSQKTCTMNIRIINKQRSKARTFHFWIKYVQRSWCNGHAFELESSIAHTRDRHTLEIVRASKTTKRFHGDYKSK